MADDLAPSSQSDAVAVPLGGELVVTAADGTPAGRALLAGLPAGAAATLLLGHGGEPLLVPARPLADLAPDRTRTTVVNLDTPAARFIDGTTPGQYRNVANAAPPRTFAEPSDLPTGMYRLGLDRENDGVTESWHSVRFGSEEAAGRATLLVAGSGPDVLVVGDAPSIRRVGPMAGPPGPGNVLHLRGLCDADEIDVWLERDGGFYRPVPPFPRAATARTLNPGAGEHTIHAFCGRVIDPTTAETSAGGPRAGTASLRFGADERFDVLRTLAFVGSAGAYSLQMAPFPQAPDVGRFIATLWNADASRPAIWAAVGGANGIQRLNVDGLALGGAVLAQVVASPEQAIGFAQTPDAAAAEDVIAFFPLGDVPGGIAAQLFFTVEAEGPVLYLETEGMPDGLMRRLLPQAIVPPDCEAECRPAADAAGQACLRRGGNPRDCIAAANQALAACMDDCGAP